MEVSPAGEAPPTSFLRQMELGKRLAGLYSVLWPALPPRFVCPPLTPNSRCPQDRAGQALLPSSWTGRLDWQWPCLELGLPAGVGSAGRGGEGTWRGDCRSGCRLRVRRRGPRGVLGLGSLVRSAGAVPASRGVGGAQEKSKGSPSGTYNNQWTGWKEAADEAPLTAGLRSKCAEGSLGI